MGTDTTRVEPRPVAALAHAKVNLFLAVGGRRDDGYHELTTVMQALDLHDTLEVCPAGTGTVLEREKDLGIEPADDLVYRAAEAWRSWAGYEGGLTLKVAKRIPAGAGLGGGSADAAATLAALASWSGTDPAWDDGLGRIAGSLGADVPFFLGSGTSLLVGRGDQPSCAFHTPSLHVALVNPGVASPTGAVYAQFDRMVAPPPPSADGMIEALQLGDPKLVAERLHNDMADAACALVPETRAALRFLEDADGVLGAAVAGSGSTAFGIFVSESSAQAAASAAAGLGWWSCATFAAPRGVDVVPDGRECEARG